MTMADNSKDYFFKKIIVEKNCKAADLATPPKK
jgi:hypothetical protein